MPAFFQQEAQGRPTEPVLGGKLRQPGECGNTNRHKQTRVGAALDDHSGFPPTLVSKPLQTEQVPGGSPLGSQVFLIVPNQAESRKHHQMLSTSEDCFHSKVGKLLKEFWYQWILKYGAHKGA